MAYTLAPHPPATLSGALGQGVFRCNGLESRLDTRQRVYNSSTRAAVGESLTGVTFRGLQKSHGVITARRKL